MRSESIDPEEIHPSIILYFDSFRTKNFQMIESTAYFESYHHVLKKLQEMGDWEDFPLQQYITGEEKEIRYEPLYYEENIRTN